ncbi:MAG TPA: ABC transporter permease [Ignavibacteriaceae bacterium]|jgi:ABC-2 type transport system permease protein
MIRKIFSKAVSFSSPLGRMGGAVLAIAKKEFRQLKRDKRLMFVIFFFPVMLLVMFGYAVNFDVKHVKIAIYDQEKSSLSRDYINSLLHSEYFDLVDMISSEKEINKYLDEKLVQCVIVIPIDLSEKLHSNREVKIQYLIDGVDGNTANIISNYANLATLTFNQKFTGEILAVKGMKQYEPIKLDPQFWFNPELKTSKFLVPGLIAMILIVTAVISVALSLVREKERGTIEQINVSPLSSLELILGKTLPFVLIALINAGFILIASYFLFGSEVRGSLLLLFLTTLIFLIASTSLGIFISVVSDTQQVAFTLATFISLLPSLILSGFIFPIDSMPYLVQIITNVTPVKFFLKILRAIMLRGVGIEAFWDQLIYLGIFTTVLIVLGTIIYKKKSQIV